VNFPAKALQFVARTGLHRGGGLGLVRRWRTGFRILTYHRFPACDLPAFDNQCRHLRTHYQPVSMGDIAASLNMGQALPRNAIAITVDDGYRDFSEQAAPVLRQHGIPATVFLVTAFMDRAQPLWWDTLQFALERTSRPEIPFGPFGALKISIAAEKTAAFDSITEKVKALPNRLRLEILEEIIGCLDVPAPREMPGEFQPMSWDEVRSLRKQGIEFGGHTRTHPILSRLDTAVEIADEIVSGKQRIERELAERTIHFSYPNGQPADWNETVLKAVREAEFATAVTTVGGVNSPADNPFLLRRIAVDPAMPPPYFAERVAGLH
jgi:peptidoglycan/xylan/chitin deacetylase (PgdA/CDA1 family)